MKRVLLILTIVSLTSGLFAQQVDRERVIVEIGTGTWCGYCPGAAMGADDLVANGCDVAVIEYHDGDSFANAFSGHRISYYGISGFPTALFDGGNSVVGGSATSSMYGSYLPVYQQCIAVQCDYEASIFGQNTSGLNYDVSVVYDLVSGTPPANLTAHLVLTESEIPYSWQGQTELNYVCRAMYPNEFGTTMNFAGGNQLVVNYTFTLDATWNTQHIELVAFLQDESGKAILQGSMVPIENLIPLAASANFSASLQQPCETTTVDFYDESLGLITSWDWYFEGGTPATSSAQNPTITYNTPGFYDVQLIVDDGSVIDTMLMLDYIEVITTPVQANAPSGPVDLCSGYDDYTYTTNSVPYAIDYTWAIDPASAGTISGNGTSATVDVDPDYTGSMDVTVRADNQCGDGIWSQALVTTVHYTPEAFWMSDGSSYCEGTNGVEVTLDGSETGVDYELYLDGDATGNIVAGTGSVLSFGYQTDNGIYTIHGYTTTCEQIMMGNAYIFAIGIPGQAAIPTGDDVVCSGEETDYSTSGATDAETYVWTLDPVDAGTITATDLDATVLWSASYTGTATITVQGINECGDGVVSDPLEVEVNALPEPLISGDEFVFQNTTHVYSSPEHTGASYNWTVTGGAIDAGQGTYEITVTWGGPGTGYVNLTETSSAQCEGVAAELIINIDPVGLDESFMNKISLYPNPVREVLNVELYAEKASTLNVHVVNQIGQIVISKTENLMSGNNKFTLNTADLQNGYYTVKLIAADGTIVQEKFIIMK
ncbi:MAG: T9SS type A sorting domain-containing protein [Bacteroidota bacterium]